MRGGPRPRGAEKSLTHARRTGPQIPDKLFFRIGEVSRLTGIEPYVLRYWETEFDALRPQKSGTGQRLYRRQDVETVLKIEHLLYEEKFTIAGARRHLQDEAGAARLQGTEETIRRIRQGLEAIIRLLSS